MSVLFNSFIRVIKENKEDEEEVIEELLIPIVKKLEEELSHGFKNNIILLMNIIYSFPINYQNFIIISAAENSCYHLTKFLLNDPRIDPTFEYNRALIGATEENSFDILELLVKDKRINPSIFENMAIKKAIKCNKKSLVNFLWKDKRVKTSLKQNSHDLYKELKNFEIQEKIENF